MIAQKVGDNPGFIDSSAVLDVESSNKGFLAPRMTTANRDAIILPAVGLLILILHRMLCKSIQR
jgi:hypothetical protein